MLVRVCTYKMTLTTAGKRRPRGLGCAAQHRSADTGGDGPSSSTWRTCVGLRSSRHIWAEAAATPRSLCTVLVLICYFNNSFHVHALDGVARPAWNLPPMTSQKAKIEQRHPFLHQCASFLEMMEHLRGGSSYGDDWKSYGNGYPEEENHGDDYYGASSNGRKGRGPPAYDDYEDYSPSIPSSTSTTTTSSNVFSSIPRILKYGDRKIGLALLTAGLAVTALGFTLFFNRALLRLGNLLFMAGVPLTIGPARTLGYLAKTEKLRATACLALGVFLVFVGHPILGILAEVFGLLNIFGNMFPLLMVFVKQVPVLGPMLSQTGGGSAKKKQTKQSAQDDYFYDNDYYADDTGNSDSRRKGGEDDYYYGQQPTAQNYYDTERDYRDRYEREDDGRGYY